MQIVHPFAGSIQHYFDEIADPDRYRPDHCPQCEAKHPLTGHGFYCRTLVDAAFDGVISVSVIALFLVARLLNGLTLAAAARAAAPTGMPYRRGQFWVRRFRKQ